MINSSTMISILRLGIIFYLLEKGEPKLWEVKEISDEKISEIVFLKTFESKFLISV